MQSNAESNLDKSINNTFNDIVNGTKDLFGRAFVDHKGIRKTLVGVVYTEDVFYYLMVDSSGKSDLLSCAASIEDWQYELLPEEGK